MSRARTRNAQRLRGRADRVKWNWITRNEAGKRMLVRIVSMLIKLARACEE